MSYTVTCTFQFCGSKYTTSKTCAAFPPLFLLFHHHANSECNWDSEHCYTMGQNRLCHNYSGATSVSVFREITGNFACQTGNDRTYVSQWNQKTDIGRFITRNSDIP